MPQVLSSAQKLMFEEAGFLVAEGVLRGELLARVRREAEALCAAEPAEVSRRIWHERALFRRSVFREILDVPELVEPARQLIGDDVQLLALDLLLVRPGSGGVGWHRDVTFVCSKTLSINTGIYLQEMTEAAGPLRVVPGSHRWEQRPDQPRGDSLPEEVRLPVSAGDAVFFDAALWHTGDRNRSSANRLALFPYFGRYWVKRMDNFFTQPLPADLLATRDPMKRQLLGLGLRPGVPSYHGDDERYNRERGEAGIDFPSTEQTAETSPNTECLIDR
jgi:ectoine hydroxylase-related dioxygenase (phytanoyl-CoA dioxygenase family)